MALGTMAMLGSTANAQKVAFEEYDLENGLHVVLHQDNSAPVVVTSVMYHVGAKTNNLTEQVLHFLNIYYLKVQKHCKRRMVQNCYS